MKNHLDTARSSTDLVAELKALLAEAETIVSGSVTEYSADALETLRERFGAMQERLASTCESAKKKVVAGAKYTDEAIRANPYQSLAIAAGVGLLVGVLLGRNSSK
ncbi:hypothetical protein CMV30_07410 [Nibricoccus aquaticus]|uniref:DUF883 domain-containing protein n=1 Tax=Nibricoccus aquaticus TaxID=2576891 RepID=A0A290QIT5_9BACT|nr:DUF883 family protein [Nibricoccus aquaticus]ATC63792.1 hypothetical protein CMV30_07410 [Nibricoccus aquaticus]